MNKRELIELLVKLKIINKKFVNEEYVEDEERWYYVYTNELTEEEIKLALLAKQTKHLNSIKNMILFFVILTVIGLICSFILVYFCIDIIYDINNYLKFL